MNEIDENKGRIELTLADEREMVKRKKHREEKHKNQNKEKKWDSNLRTASKLMAIILMIVATVFTMISGIKANKLMHDTASNGPASTLTELVSNINKENNTKEEPVINLDNLSDEFRLLAEFELESVRVRHIRSVSFIQTRLWLRFSSMTLGFICVVIGCAFIIGNIQSPKLNANAEGMGIKGSISTASPGLALVAFGIVLCIIPNVASQPIANDDTSTYLKTTTFVVNTTKNRSDVLNKILKQKKGLGEIEAE